MEGLYTIDRGTTEILVAGGLREALVPAGSTDRPAADVVRIVSDHHDALEGLFDFVTQRRLLTTGYVREVHHLLTRHQSTVRGEDALGHAVETPLAHGDYKHLPNNPSRPNGSVHEYCPPEHVAAEMDRLLEMHARHAEERVPPEVEAAWIHHRFIEIHPFQDGNGRVARLLASLIFIKEGWFPLALDRDVRVQYIDALEAADSGDLGDLIRLFADAQKKELKTALSLASDVVQDEADAQTRRIIDAAAERLRRSTDLDREPIARRMNRLQELATTHLLSVHDQLSDALCAVDRTRFEVEVQDSEPYNDHLWQSQVDSIARELGYFVHPRTRRGWVRLAIREGQQRSADLVLSFHALGTNFVGVLAASAFIEYWAASGEHGAHKEDGPYKICSDIFQYTIDEDQPSVEERFRPWLQETVLFGLDHWRRRL